MPNMVLQTVRILRNQDDCRLIDVKIGPLQHPAVATIMLCFFCGFVGFALGMTA